MDGKNREKKSDSTRQRLAAAAMIPSRARPFVYISPLPGKNLVFSLKNGASGRVGRGSNAPVTPDVAHRLPGFHQAPLWTNRE